MGGTVRSGRLYFPNGDSDYEHILLSENIYSRHFTFVFNVFVMMQVFNFLNARKLHEEVLPRLFSSTSSKASPRTPSSSSLSAASSSSKPSSSPSQAQPSESTATGASPSSIGLSAYSFFHSDRYRTRLSSHRFPPETSALRQNRPRSLGARRSGQEGRPCFPQTFSVKSEEDRRPGGA